MKKIVLIGLCFLYTAQIYSQKLEKLYIPYTKENAKVDSLFDFFIHENTFTNTCYLLNVRKHAVGGGYEFMVVVLRLHLNVFMLPSAQWETNIKYFKYKKCYVFVSGDSEPYKLFSKSNKKKSFLVSIASNHPVNDYNSNLIISGFYTYTENNFRSTIIVNDQ